VGSQLEVLCMLLVRAGEALSSPFLDTLLPHSRIKVLELAPESASQQRRALVSTVSVEPKEEHIQGWVSLCSSTGALLVRLAAGATKLPKAMKASAQEGKEESADANTRVQMVTKLLELARSGDLEAFKAIAEAGVLEPGTDRSGLSPVSPTRHTKTLINRSDIRGRTALMYASAIGSRDIVDYLLSKGEVYVNAVDDTQKTALHHAVKSSKAEISRLLLRAGAMIDARDHNGCTALMLAAGTGDVDGVQVLLEKGANANARDYLGNSALSYAQDFNHQEVMDKLIQAGAEDDEEEEDSVVKSRKKRVRAETVNQEDLEKAAALAVLDDDDGLTEEEQRRAGAHERLKEVLEGTALTRDLEAALEEATQAQVEDESLLSTARSRLQDLKDRDDASDHLMAALEEARQGCRGPENLQALQEALEKAKAKGVAEKELQHGEQVLAEEMPRAQARQQLRDAQAKGSSALREAIALAKEARLPAEELQPFEELLSGAESKEAAAAALRKATDARDVAALTFALQQAKEAGVDPELLATSEAVLAVEAPKQEAREALAAQLAKVHAAGDKGPSLEELTVLESAIERARSVELPEAEFAQALDILAQEQQRAMCKKEVAKVVEKLKDVDRNSMEALEEAKEELFNALLAAKAVEVPSAALREADSLRRRIHNALEDLKGSIRVFCRIRPISKREKELQDVDVTELVDSMTVNTQKPSYGSIANDPEQFNFDAVFKPGTQAEVFDTCKDLVQSALDGYNVAMFAYGQTGAGKTFTMYGSGTGDNAGTAPRTIAELYRLIKQDEDRVQFTVMASMMELYRNELVDLLVPKSTGTSPKRRSQNPGSAALEQKLNVRVDKSGAVQIEHLREEECKTAEALSDLLERGNQMRTVCATKMNSESSRSHLILIIRVVGVNKQTEQKLSGKLLLCDLAGSERLKKSDVSGDAQKEAIEINKSLTALGDVMESLVKGAAHVPYKNHKLTQVMSDALGGTSKTLMFVNCSPASSNYEETVMTLKFATRAKTITNDVKRKMVAKAKPMPKA